jgi:membrane-bound lytic murein transglycosylase A
MRRLALSLAAAGVCAVNMAFAQASYTLLDWSDLRAWQDDDHAAAFEVFKETCTDLDDPNWSSLCAIAHDQPSGTSFFELFFLPVLIEDGNPGLFTGYYEPELRGSRTPNGVYRFPIYRKPPEVQRGALWHSRADIENYGLLRNRGLEIAWLDDPVDAFFLQIQGSGRIRLNDGTSIRVGYGGRNGHDYKSVGQELVRQGLYKSHQVSAATIRSYVRRNPEAGRQLLQHNPSFIFFREVSEVPSSAGPLGAMNRSITAMRSIAVDPEYVPLGAPVWVEKDGKDPLRRLMIAQDTGSAIKGAQRADIFFGSGADAGKKAGRTKDAGRMITLLPIPVALQLTSGG